MRNHPCYVLSVMELLTGAVNNNHNNHDTSRDLSASIDADILTCLPSTFNKHNP